MRLARVQEELVSVGAVIGRHSESLVGRCYGSVVAILMAVRQRKAGLMRLFLDSPGNSGY